jgi:toxin ParE1/3/4
MAAYKLIVAPAAKNDLKDIYLYGTREWGQAQSESYLSAIKNQLWLLTEQPFIGVERAEISPEIRSLVIQSHTVFYRLTNRQIEIIRVLHGRQDPLHHIK